MKFDYVATPVIRDAHLGEFQDRFGQNSIVTDCQQTVNQKQNSLILLVPNMTCPQHDLLGLLKQTKHALKQQLGGPCDALLRISDLLFTFALCQSAEPTAAPQQ